MKRLRFRRTGILCILLFMCFVIKAQSPLLRQKLQNQQLHYAAHRGGHLQSPENSIAAIAEAIEAGATVVEVDVRATKDGVLILMHDKTVDRTTSGKGKVSDLTFQEIQQLFLRDTPYGVIGKHKVPTLEDALSRSKGRIIVDLDFKEERKGYDTKTYALINTLNMDDEVLFFLYDYRDMQALYSLNSKITLMPRARSVKELKEIVKSNLTFVAHIDESFDNNEELMALRNKDFYLWINTLGDTDEQALLIGTEVYQDFLKKYPFVRIIQTDNPFLWKTMLNR